MGAGGYAHIWSHKPDPLCLHRRHTVLSMCPTRAPGQDTPCDCTGGSDPNGGGWRGLGCTLLAGVAVVIGWCVP